ncbi:3-phosphoglycerate dehydrogenase [Stappia sp. GBMRC 2046]|uniref:3-phosphoglycerate dehydrogenase n=1 Tax=Stappia sediminis TaxID=2692190 RepID=A0A7X3S6J0_9HYPH|nr:hydroxyacid dehydrogenase [Stappia sediminis]MXN63991.1 3-phosphoglycerate dehydrogenase [Stappia sediminis]
MPHVLVVGKIHASGIRLLEETPDLTFETVDGVTEESYAPLIHNADALVIRTQPMTAPTIAMAKRLKVVSRHGVGYDAVDGKALARRGIPLVVVGDVNSISVAEHSLMMMLAATKLAIRSDRAVRDHNWSWRNGLEAGELSGKNLLIVGYGRIGRRVGALASAFEMTVRAFDPYLAAKGWPEGEVAPAETLHDGLAWADVVSVNVPRPDRPLIGRKELAVMKPAAVLVNTARGGIVDEDALIAALQEGKLRAAGLDVFDDEPPAPENPLLKMDNVVLSPHIGGLTREGGERLALHSVRNVIDFFAGRLDPELVVNGVLQNA